MVDIDKAVIARLNKKGKEFEILVDCDKAFEFKQGKCTIEEALATMDIYKNVKQDEKATEEDIMEVFETKDPGQIAVTIIKEGEIQLTTEHRNKLREDLKKKVVELLRRNAVDGKTGLPHPADRIERALEQKSAKIDESKTAEQQLKDVAAQINDVLPLKFEMRELSVKISAEHAGKAFGTLKNLGKIITSDWLSDGALLAMIEIPAGMQPEFEDQLNKLTQGHVEIKITKKK